MALQCGIVGLPNVGKSTLFNCLSNAKAQSANFPFCTIEPNVGVISVPDDRLVLRALIGGLGGLLVGILDHHLGRKRPGAHISPAFKFKDGAAIADLMARFDQGDLEGLELGT